jgi:hypothetical protein
MRHLPAPPGDGDAQPVGFLVNLHVSCVDKLLVARHAPERRVADVDPLVR